MGLVSSIYWKEVCILAETTKKKEIDMLHGKIAGPMFAFMFPLAITSVLQQMFNTADVMILGRFVGTNALAAVGNNSPVIGLLVNLFMGVSLGANVVIAQFIGARNFKKTTQAVHTSFMIALIFGVSIAILGEIIAHPILNILGVPPEVMESAELYLRIYLLGMPAMALYNFEAAIFRSRGDTKTPLRALIVSSGLNIILDLLSVLVLHWDVAGVAAATSLSNFVGAFILLHALHTTSGVLHINPGMLKIHKPYAREILRIGVPAGVQGMVFSLSNLVIQAAINSLGATVMAASAAAFIIEINAYSFIVAFGQTITTFVGQNFGALNLKRCKDVTRVGILIGLGFTLILSGGACIFAEPLLYLFNDAPSIIEIGTIRVHYIIGFYTVYLFIEMLSGALRGYGYSLPPALLMLVTICGIRILWIYTVFPMERTFKTIMLSYPISWGITVVLLILIYRHCKNNIWKKFSKAVPTA